MINKSSKFFFFWNNFYDAIKTTIWETKNWNHNWLKKICSLALQNEKRRRITVLKKKKKKVEQQYKY